MIVCQRCGHRNEDGSTFCSNPDCKAFLEWNGTKVGGEQTSAAGVAVEPKELHVQPGSEASCDVQVRNEGTIVDEYTLAVSGDAAGWCSVEPSVVRLLPGTSGTVRLALRPPRTADVPAGPAGFVVTASSTVRGDVRASAAGTVTVAPFTDLSATLVPQVSEGVDAAEHSIAVGNQGNTPVRVTLTVTDPDDVLSASLSAAQLVVGPGQTAGARLQVAPRRRLERSEGARRSFQVVVQPAGGSKIVLEGAFVPLTRPPSWLQRHRLWVVGAAAVVLLGVGGWQAAARGLLSGPGNPTSLPLLPTATSTPSAAATPTPTRTATPSPSPQRTPTAAGFRVVELLVRADPSNYTGACPVTITFSARISAAGGQGLVSYRFRRSDNASAPVQTLTFNGPGTRDFTNTWRLGGPGFRYSGWQEVEILDPAPGRVSQRANFTVACT